MDFFRKLFAFDTHDPSAEPNPVYKIAEDSVNIKRIKYKPTYHDLECYERVKRFFRYHWRGCVVLATPLCLIKLVFGDQVGRSGFVFLLVIIYWVSECLPVMITSMLPIVLLPLMGIMGSDETCRSYFKDTTLVMMGGIIIAMTVEYSNLHHRLALLAIRLFTCYPRVLHLALMVITYILSNLMTNTATATLMMSIVRAILEILYDEGVVNIYEEIDKQETLESRRPTPIAIAFYLGTAYAATIGGVGSLIGSGTNLAFKYEWTKIYYGLNDTQFELGDDVEIKYDQFLYCCLPISMILLCCTYLYLQIYLMGLWRPTSTSAKRVRESNMAAKQKKDVFKEKYKDLHTITCHEVSILVLILLLLVLYFTRSPDFFNGWAELVSTKMQIKAALPTILVVVLIFLLPSSYKFLNYFRRNQPLPDKSIPALLTWKYIHDHMPWSLIFVVGGGFAIGKSNKSTKLVHKVAAGLLEIRATTKSNETLIFEIITLSVFLTAFGSNVSTVDQLFGFLAEVCVVTRKHPLLLFFPSVLACSMAFHLPVSTPPNAIACGFGNIKTKDIILSGIGPTLSAIFIIEVFCLYWLNLVYSNKALDEFPSWAKHYNKTI